jgi:hypothetical protein
MAEVDEFRPKDWSPIEIQPGRYVLVVKVKKCAIHDKDKEKPYMLIVFIVTDGSMKGFEFDNRVYLSRAAEWRARYFLKKFDYPAELLEQQVPPIRPTVITGLEGKVLVEFEKDNFDMLKTEIKKFDHIGGTEIEEFLAKNNQTANQTELPLGVGRTDSEPANVIDLNADMAGSTPIREPGDDTQPAGELDFLD